MKTILVLTDFSKKANSAAEFALQMAINTGAKIILANAMESIRPLPEEAQFNWLPSTKQLYDKYLIKLQTIVDHLKEIIPADSFYLPTIEPIALPGSLTQVTTQILKEHAVDLIVCGSHKNGGLLNFFSKSHSHSIMDDINCPALFVPESYSFKELKTITYATDLSFNNAKVLPFLADLATPFGAALQINHISAGDFDAVLPKYSVEYSLKKLLQENKPQINYSCIRSANVRKALLDMTRSGETEMLTLVHKKYDFLDSLLHQSISKELAGTAEIPVLVLPYSFSQNTADFSNEELDEFCYRTDESR